MINRGKLLFYGMLVLLTLSIVTVIGGVGLFLYAIFAGKVAVAVIALAAIFKGGTWLYVAYSWFTRAA